MPTLSMMLMPRGLIVHPGRGRALVDGEQVPSVDRVGLETLIASLSDERIVRDLPLEVSKLLPSLRKLASSLTELSEGLQKRSPVRGLLGAGDDPDKSRRK